MGEKVTKITREALIPLGVVGALVLSMATSVYMFASLATKVEAMEKNESPTRYEYNSDIGAIKLGIDNINKYILSNK